MARPTYNQLHYFHGDERLLVRIGVASAIGRKSLDGGAGFSAPR